MTEQPRRARNLELDVPQHLHQHDDDLDTYDRALGLMNRKLDRLLWLLFGAMVSGSTSLLLWTIQFATSR